MASPRQTEYRKGVQDIDSGNLSTLDLRVVNSQVATPSHAYSSRILKKVRMTSSTVCPRLDYMSLPDRQIIRIWDKLRRELVEARAELIDQRELQ
ncbi:hypothetical protein CRG98_014218 [Punica granatum]|uniref:Uncharacterized protein n=1 Tax=Punica granatum TaxID=22663 RepID=A0A2I0KA35_PUNGR|nr:hypothetical protein CRG98_014218 [Punica granatum]